MISCQTLYLYDIFVEIFINFHHSLDLLLDDSCLLTILSCPINKMFKKNQKSLTNNEVHINYLIFSLIFNKLV